MNTVTSRDGTTIAFEQSGQGPAVILVASALADRSGTRKLAALLADRFSVINYDRRGRGESGDTQPYAVEREIEDLEALLHATGGPAMVFGSSSGAVLALRAAAAGLDIQKLALFEPPFRVDHTGPAMPANYEARLAELIASGRRSDALKLFFSKAVGLPAPFLLLIRLMPGMWSKLTARAHTLLYDHAVMGDTLAGTPLSAADWATVRTATLVMDGGKSPAWLRNAVERLVNVLPNATRITLQGQHHGAVEMAPKSVVAAVIEFLNRDQIDLSSPARAPAG
jgi:pimeloyl-ACP methyl ester carboxylesterase